MTDSQFKNRNKVKLSVDDKIYYALTYTFLFLFLLIIVYPLIYIVSASFSSAAAVTSGRVFLWPVEPGLEGYKAVFKHPNILNSYKNAFIYTVVGTCINLAMTMNAAYPLSRRDMPHKGLFMFLFTFTMFFSGGLVPTYLLVSRLRMTNTVWAMLIPGALSVYNMIVARTFIQNSIPVELLEAARIDGCSWGKYFLHVVLPLSKAVIAVITLFYAVGHWNAYFGAFIYLSNRSLHPLQLVLREILVENSIEVTDVELENARQNMRDLLKYALIVVSTVPVLCFYPFVQKYFVTGVMVGSIKG